ARPSASPASLCHRPRQAGRAAASFILAGRKQVRLARPVLMPEHLYDFTFFRQVAFCVHALANDHPHSHSITFIVSVGPIVDSRPPTRIADSGPELGFTIVEAERLTF